jgi:hypothetical protein
MPRRKHFVSKIVENKNQPILWNKLTNYKHHFYLPESIYKTQTQQFLLKYEDIQLTPFPYTNKTLYNIIHYFHYLLKTIEILNENNIDFLIDSNHILIDAFDRPLIDIFSPYSTTIQPPELHFVSYLTTNKIISPSYNNIQTFIEQYNIHHLTDFFQQYINKTVSYIRQDIEKYKYSWNIYNLSFLILSITKFEDNQFTNLLVDYIHLEPSKRHLFCNNNRKFITC